MRFAGHGVGCPAKEYRYRPPLLSLDDLQPVEVLRFRRKQRVEPSLVGSVERRPRLSLERACHLRRGNAHDHEAVVGQSSR
jgi:hypothetical protein